MWFQGVSVGGSGRFLGWEAPLPGVRVLVVEDELALAEATRLALVADGFDVDVASDGVTGEILAASGRYDAILLDVLLPGRNGFAVCRNLRAAGQWTPIIMLTAKNGEWDEAEALDGGADDFLSKPFSPVVLSARIRNAVRRSSASSADSSVLVCGDLRVDPVRRTCARGDVEVALTPREFDLVEALVAADGRALSRDELLHRLWGSDFDGDPSLVAVYIRYIREKLDRPFGRDTFRTVRGAGYCAAADR